MIYLNLISIPVNAFLVGALKDGWLKAINAAAVFLNVAVVASHLASVA